MRVCSISWNGDSDETKVKFNDEFASSDWIVRADVLKDALEILQEEYSKVLEVEAVKWHARMQKKNNLLSLVND
jgi:hypothetical protein